MTIKIWPPGTKVRFVKNSNLYGLVNAVSIVDTNGRLEYEIVYWELIQGQYVRKFLICKEFELLFDNNTTQDTLEFIIGPVEQQ